MLFVASRRCSWLTRSGRFSRKLYSSQSLFRDTTLISPFSTIADNAEAPKKQAALNIGILRETYDIWERRAPLTPSQVKQLIQENKGRLSFTVQPSARRIFLDNEYSKAGAIVAEDLTKADVVMGVKRPKKLAEDYLIPNKAYMFFSHTVKGQPENMGLLQDCLERNIQLFDYERITANKCVSGGKSSKKIESKSTGKARNGTQAFGRLVSFGHFAGIAGSLDAFHVLGRKLLHTYGASTPFLTFPPTIMHDSLDEARDRVLRLGERVFHEGIYSSTSDGKSEPLVFAVTGKGGCVHRGAMEILQMLPHEIVAVSYLPEVFQNQQTGRGHKIYITQIDIEDVVQRRNGDLIFDRCDYKKHPTEYRSLFAKRVAPYSHVIINCAYWDARYPRLLTKRQMKRIYESGNERLLLVADISCDVHGAIEFLERTTTIDKPSFQYDPHLEREIDGGLDNGITVLGVDILPAELPRESSSHFGNALTGVVKELLHAKEHQDPVVLGIDTNLMSVGLADSCITTTDGSLTPGFQYLKTLMNRVHKDIPEAQKSMVLSLDGHLFDSGLINQILDVVERSASGLEIKDCFFPPNSGKGSAKSHVVLKINSASKESLHLIEKKIHSLVHLIEKGQATVIRVDRNADATMQKISQVQVEDLKREKRVLLLGAGRVSKSFVKYLGRSGDSVISVVSDKEEEARDASSAASKGQHVCLDIANDLQRLSTLIEDSDLVVSLLPAPMHPPVAVECIVHKTDLVTASYESDEMRSMNERAMAAGCIILNEVGLDPGLDHTSAMKIIDDIKSRGGTVTSFSSVCGGLPAPEAVEDTELKYKFSWSPRGVLSACLNDARYRWGGQVMEIQGAQLLQSAAPFVDAWQDLELECLPNRDALKYEQVYGIDGALNVFRGTLRYRGFSSLMNTFKNLGLFDSRIVVATTWAELIDELRARRGGFANVPDFVLACADDDRDEADRALGTLEWLEILGEKPVPRGASVIDSFCNALEQKLVYQEGERDMVVMHHTIDATFEEESTHERHHSSLQVFGDKEMSAMAKTVGYTAAASAELILEGGLRGECGLLLPTNPKIYAPVLDSLQLEDITFDESVFSHPLRAENIN